MLESTETKVPIIRVKDSADSVAVLGGRSRFLVHSDEVGGAYAILEQTIPAGHGPPLHVHRHETEIFYVVDGLFEIRVGGQTILAGPGSCATCPRDIPHTFRNVGEGPALLHLTILPGYFGKYFEEIEKIDDSDLDAVRKLTARYGVELVESTDIDLVSGHRWSTKTSS